ncbi:alpha/beta hydrolase [uncultured Algimonas sp.]|uniref:alpha/beta hydrolase n=1 Tax=uncultured Algimonas sp. TaxID=1547920 RepID=UPI00262ABFA4|nr:alpha/beta hydrolase [uncultured Algimonas sp.]
MDDCHTFQLASADGTTLQARHWEAKTPHATLALVHGFGEHSARYQPMAEYLGMRGIQTVAADLRGHGRSDGKRGVTRRYDDFRDDLSALLARARQLHDPVKGPLVLFGHSMGGGIVLDHGLRPEPGVDGIIASAPLIALADPVSPVLRSIIAGVAKVLPRASMKQTIDGAKISTLPQEQKAYENDALTHGRMGLRTALGLVENGEALSRHAERWSLPLLIYHSEGDQLTDFDASRNFAKAAQAEFKMFSGVEHEMHNDSSRPSVYAMIGDFIDRLAGRH